MRSIAPLITGLAVLLTLDLPGLQPTRADDTGETVVIAACTKDLANRLNVDPGQIKLVTITPEVWPDASLGHPEPGMVYVQMLITGYRVILGSPSGPHEYHTDAKARIVYCGAAKPNAPEPPPVVVACQDDLTKRLRLKERPAVVEIAPVVWPDTSLGLPHSEARFAAMPTPGFKVLLAAKSDLWEYHTARTVTFEYVGKSLSVAFSGETALLLLRKTAVPGAYDLCLRRADGLFEKRLTPQILPDFSVSRGGRILAIAGKPEAKCTLGLYSADGKQQRAIATRPFFQHPAWSADGTRFAVWVPRPEQPADSVLAIGQPAAGDLQVADTVASGRAGSSLLWAGDWVLCHTHRNGASVTAAYDARTRQAQSFLQPGEAFAVSRDGRRILLRDDNETPPHLWLNEGRADKRTLVCEAADLTCAAFLSGGDEILIARGARLLRRNAADRGEERLLATLPGPVVSLSLDPLQGQQALVVCADRDGSFRVSVVDVGSGAVGDAGSADSPVATWLVIPEK